MAPAIAPILEPLALYSEVRLRHAVDTPEGKLLPGAAGRIVHVYDANAAFEVEFDTPFRDVVTLTVSDFAA